MPTKLGQFEILSELAKSPTGVVYKANDAESGLVRLETLVAEATPSPQQSLIAEAVDLVIFVDEDSGLKAGRKVKQVVFVSGFENGRYLVEHL